MKMTHVGGAASLLCTLAAHASPTVNILIEGVRIQNGLNQSRNSGTQTIDPAYRYSARFSANTMAQGSGLVLGSLFPTPTPIATIIDTFSPGASANLVQSGVNPTGQLPAAIPPQTFNTQTTLVGIPVTFAMTLTAAANAQGVCSFSITGVTISPSALVGSLLFTQGFAIVTAHCGGDLTLDQAITIDDLLLFLAYFEAGDVQGDMNGDNAVTIDDLLGMLTFFENGC